MADFCKQCSEELFEQDFKELAGITKPTIWAEGKSCIVLCEGCGLIQVDPEGRCVSTDCLRALSHKRQGARIDKAGFKRGFESARELGERDTFLRPELFAFSSLMESVLRDNDHKGGWEDESADSLLVRLDEERLELQRAVESNRPSRVIARKAADVANFAMMIADVVGGISDRTKPAVTAGPVAPKVR